MSERGTGTPSEGPAAGSRSAARHEFDALAAVVDGGVVRTDADNRVAAATDAFVDQTGGERAAVVGEPVSDLFGEAAGVDAELRRLRDAEAPDAATVPVVAAEGTRELELRSVVADGAFLGAVGVLRPPSGRESPAERQRALDDVYDALTATDQSFVERLDRLLGVVREAVGTDFATLSRVSDDEYVFEAVQSPDGVDLEPGDTVQPEELPVCGHVVETEQTLVHRDVQAEAPELADPEWGISCYIGAPVTVEGDVYGTFCFYGTEPADDAFSEWDATLVEFAANWVSHELEQRRTRERLRRRNQELEASEQRYRTLAENFSNGAVALVDHDLRYTTAGGRPVDAETETSDELEGRTVREAVTEEFADVLEPKYRAALDGELSTFEYDTGDGVARIRTFPVRDDDGDVLAAMGMSQDVTDQKERERELSKYKSLVETVNEGIYVVDDDYRYTTVNDAFVELSGYSREELLGSHASLLVDDATLEEAADVRTADDGPSSLETTMERADGSEVPVEVTFTALEGDDGGRERVGVVRDVTERVEQRRRLEESEQRYRALVENFPNGAVGLFDHDLRYTAAGGELMDQFDVSPESRVGRRVHDLYPDDLIEEVKPYLEAALDGETRSFDVEYGGSYLSARVLPIRRVDGGVDAGMLVVQDVTEQKEYERRLERTLDLLEQTERVADVGGWEIDPETMDVFWSDQLFDLLGVDADEEPPLEEALDVYHEDDRPVVRDAVETALESGESFDVEVRFRRPDGEVRWLRVQGTPETEGGDVVSLRGAAQDVTEQKERERFLEDAKAQMEAAAEAGAVGTWEWHVAEDRFVTDAALARMFGLDPERAREGVPLEALVSSIHEDDRERVQVAIEAAAESCGEYEDEYRVHDADGNLRWVVARGHVECDGDGNPQTFPGALTDITDQKRVERALDRQREQLETLFEVLPVGVVVADADGRVVDANDVAEDIWGEDVLDASSVADYGSYDVRWEGSGERVSADEYAMAKVLRGEELLDPDVYEIRDADGNERVVMVHGMPVFDGGDVVRGVVTTTDVTERREYQRKLEASNERLEQFAYAASHDLQEPLRMVSSYLSLLDQRYGDALDEDAREFIEYAVDGADRMQEMIDGLLEYSRVETEGDSFEPVDLDAVFEDVRRDFEVRIEETDASVDAASLPTVRGDADQLRRVFANLLSNAIEYSGGDPPDVSVSASREGDEWVVAVSDDGIGIDPEHADRVFEVFQRLHTHDEHPGTGIGLALAERIVERHGGDIWVESEPGEGATFYFSVPDWEGTDD